MKTDYDIVVTSVLELADMAEICHMRNKGLSDMFSKITGKSYVTTHQKSDWERDELSQLQIDYATAEVKVAWDCFIHFRKMLCENDNKIRDLVNL